MTAIAADFENVFAQSPPFARALEALSAIMAQHGRSRMVQWARMADDDATRICAVLFENTTLALALLRDLDRAHRSGNGWRRCAGGSTGCSTRSRRGTNRTSGARLCDGISHPSGPSTARRCETTNEPESGEDKCRHRPPVLSA